MALRNFTFPGKLGTTQLTGNTITNEEQLRQLAVDRVRAEAEKRLYEDSFVAKMFPQNLLQGTSNTRIDAMGGTPGMQKVQPAQEIPTSEYKFGVHKFSVDTTAVKRARLPELAEIQSHLPAISMIGEDQGRELAEFIDETYMIMATKAGLLTQTPFTGVTAAEGFTGGSNVSVGSQQDSQDPAKLFNALRQLEMAMFKKKVNWSADNGVLVVTPEAFFTLESNELLVDRNIKWSDGTMLEARALKALGVPVVRSNVFPGGRSISNHVLSNTSNSSAYDGDFTKVIGTLVTRRALQDAYAIKPKYVVHWDEKDLCHYVTTRVAMGIGIARPEHAGVITFA